MLILRALRNSSLRSTSALHCTRVRDFSDEKKPPSEESTGKSEDQNEEKKPTAVESAADRLNKLLASMQTDDNMGLMKKAAIPKAVGRKHRTEKAKQSSVEEKKPQNIIEAAKNVASLMGEQKKQTESELLSKLMNHIDDTSSAESHGEKKAEELSLNDLIVGMKIDRSERAKTTPTRGQYVRKVLEDRRDKNQEHSKERPDRRRTPLTEPQPYVGSVNLFGGEPLGIFKNKSNLNASPDILPTWEHLYKRELKMAITYPPANYFEKMIVWTEQGKLWKFPIDNEQGLDEEAKVDFTEHIFLEQHLESWCPTKGPVRHFMELVCVGLSKNPYITAQEKMEHILWYKDYFEQKKDIIKKFIYQEKESTAEKKTLESS